MRVLNTRKLEKKNGINADIIDVIHKNIFVSVPQVKKFAEKFRGGSLKATSFNIWQYLRRMNYVKDTNENQLIKLPARLVQDQAGDCKSYALFAASILKALGYPAKFRYTSYMYGNMIPTHIYTVTKDRKGNEIIIDGVYNKFNQEANYQSKRDVLINGRYK